MPALIKIMFYDTDIDTFLADFGEDVTYYPKNSTTGTAIKGIFDEPGTFQTIGNTAIIIEEMQIRVATTDVPGVSNDARIVRGGVTYYVRGPRDDGTGFTILPLSKV